MKFFKNKNRHKKEQPQINIKIKVVATQPANEAQSDIDTSDLDKRVQGGMIRVYNRKPNNGKSVNFPDIKC